MIDYREKYEETKHKLSKLLLKYDDAETELFELREELNQQYQNNYALISRIQFLEEKLSAVRKGNRRGKVLASKRMGMR